MISEERLAGEWYVLEEDEPLDRLRSTFWTFRDGQVFDGASERVLGRYVPAGDVVCVELTPNGQATAHEMSIVAGPHANALQTSSTISFGEEPPLETYGALIRRSADVHATPPAWPS